MADAKISQLTASATPLAGTEVLPIVQSSTTKKVSVANLTAGRAVSALSFEATAGNISVTGPGNILQVLNGASVQIQNSPVTANWNLATSGSGLSINSPQNGTLGIANNTAITGTLNITDNLIIGTAGKGIDFSADGQAAGMTSELLDDYEEGTWTPVLATSAVNFASVTYDAAVYGLYTKIGNVVHIQGMMRTDAVDATGATGLPIISGLPFTSSSGGGFRDVALSITRVEGFVINNPSSAVVNENSVNIFPVYRSTANGIDAYLPLASIGTGADNNIMYFSGTYTAA
jgi:hypothetical protein